MTGPAVSVCIPAFNAEKFIEETIASVLAQTFEDFELVVVDNCSDDKTADIVAGFDDPRLRLLRNESNIGAEANWNRAVEQARGEFVKVLCADDIVYPRCLERQVDVLRAHPGAAFTAAKRDIVDAHGTVLLRDRGLFGMAGEIRSAAALARVVRSGTNPFGEPVAVLMRTEARRQAGAFDGSRPYMIDVDLWCRLLDWGSVVAVPETVGAFRVSLDSWSYALARRQVTQARGLFGELHRRHPEAISRRDMLEGSVRAWTLMGLRRLAYTRMRMKAARP